MTRAHTGSTTTAMALALTIVCALTACSVKEPPTPTDSARADAPASPAPVASPAPADSDSTASATVDPSLAAPGSVAPIPARRPRPVKLTPLADTIATKLVFAPTNQTWFLAASRGKRLLVDIGRVDMEVRRDPAKLAAYKLAVEARSPVPIGARLRLHGAWGADDAEVNGFDTWNGRIVMTIITAPRVDSIARVTDTLPVTAQLADTVALPTTDSCAHRAADSTLSARLVVVKDSILAEMRQKEAPPFARLSKTLKDRATQVVGCFAEARAVVFATMWAGEYEWVKERAVLVDSLGAVKPLRVLDYRFKGHDAIYALDGDGDGVDDLAARGSAEHTGGTVVLRLVEGKRLERLAAGFVWENR